MRIQTAITATVFFAIGAVASTFYFRAHPEKPPMRSVDILRASVPAGGAPTFGPAGAVPAAPRAQTYEERLAAAQADTDDPVAAREAVLVEWIHAHRAAAMRYLAANGYKDLALPRVARAVGQNATPAELVDIANGADKPGDVIDDLGKNIPPAALNDFASMMDQVSPGALRDTAAAVGGLLAGLNVDRAVAFALGLGSDEVRAAAMAGVFDELRGSAAGPSEVLSLYNSLQPALQSDSRVLFSYGNAVWGSDPSGALSALENIGDPHARMLALVTLSQRAASAAPDLAIAAVYASGLSDQGVYNHVSRILQNWNAVDPQAASNFLATTQIIPVASVPKYRQLIAPPGGG